MHSRNILHLCVVCIILTSCGTRPIQPSTQHIQQPPIPVATADSIPSPIKNSVALPPPKPVTKVETYSVVVTNVSAQEILFALARDAKINLDIHPGIEGAVTINAINQTLPQILSRIAKQVDMRYELDNGTLIVMPDSPYLHSYKIDYVNMSRDADGGMSNTTQVGSTSVSGNTGSNNSSLTIKNQSKNHFWDTLTQNIKDILRETDKIFPEGSSETLTQQSSSSNKTGVVAPKAKKKANSKNANDNQDSIEPIIAEEEGTTVTRKSTFREAASVIANPENGIITVRATGKQHEKIQEFVDKVMVSAQRQVLIEATIVEVRLNDNYQQGIDWAQLRLGGKGFQLKQSGSGLPATRTGSMFTLDYLNPATSIGKITASISLLESFGKVKVLSSPKLSVMNNQTAMLRVVENNVYFTVNSTVVPCTTAGCTNSFISYTTIVNTVPIGFTMSVTPQINDNDSVLLNIRPSITRLIKNAVDPTPGLSVANFVPQTSTREMESMLKIENNQIAVLGGMMEDRVEKLTDEVPFMASIPILGNLFQNRNDTTSKTELVIFLRPVVIKDANVNGDFSNFRDSLPDENFFKEPTNSLLQTQ